MNNENTPNPTESSHQTTWSSKKVVVLIAVLVSLLILVVAATFIARPAGNAQSGGQVVLSGKNFMPKTIEIQAGQAVTWTNSSSGPFAIVSDAPESSPTDGFSSGGRLLEGDTFTYTFEDAGTYKYYSPNDPVKLKGTVVVKE